MKVVTIREFEKYIEYLKTKMDGKSLKIKENEICGIHKLFLVDEIYIYVVMYQVHDDKGIVTFNTSELTKYDLFEAIELGGYKNDQEKW